MRVTALRAGLALAGFLVAAGCTTTPAPEAAAPRAPFLAAELARGPALAPGTALTRIGLGSCLKQDKPFPIGEAILAARPQLFIMAGDNVYGDSESPALDELVGAYAALNARPDWRRFRTALPMLATWDDHDYGLNDAGAEYPHKAAAQRLFAQFWDLPPASPVWTREGIYEALIVGPEGRRVQIILLDTRSFRAPLRPTDDRNAPGKERYLPDADPQKTLLGTAQWAWLEDELRKPADLRLIVSSIQVVAAGHGWERWGNLPAEQRRLYDLIARTGAERVVFLSGDRHQGALYRETAGVPYPFYELTSSSLNHAFPNIAKPDLETPARISPMYEETNFGLVEIDWAAGTLRMSLRDETGKEVSGETVRLAELTPPR